MKYNWKNVKISSEYGTLAQNPSSHDSVECLAATTWIGDLYEQWARALNVTSEGKITKIATTKEKRSRGRANEKR